MNSNVSPREEPQTQMADESAWPFYEPDEVEAVVRVLQSGRVNYWTGPECRAFEAEFADFCDRRHAISLANGTLALELALRALQIGPGDEVIVTPRSFVASASCIVNCGARPVFADVDPDSQNLTPESIERAITPDTKGILLVHLAGWPCEMDAIMALARKRGLKVIEDCAQAHGAEYRGRRVGGFGDVAAFSFCQDKIISTGGEGGMLLCDDEAVWRRAWSYKDHGKNLDIMSRKGGQGYSWPHTSIGSNFRMTGMQAAIGRIQLRKLPAWLERRRHNAARLDACLRDIPACRVVACPDEVVHARYKYYTSVRADALQPGWSRDRIVGTIRERGVACGMGSCSELYLERPFQENGWAPETRLPVAKQLGEESLLFEVHHRLGDREMDETCQVILDVMAEASSNQPG